MSEENVNALSRSIGGWAQHDFRAEKFPTETFDEQIEWDISEYPLPDWPNVGAGRADFQRHMIGYVSGWRAYRAEPREMIDGGDEIVVVLHETVSMIGGETELERDLHQVFTFRDGAVVRLRVFKTRSEALEAAGLSE